MKKPSASIINSITSEVSNFDSRKNKEILEEWCRLLCKLRLFDIGFTSALEGVGDDGQYFHGSEGEEPLESGVLFEFAINLDPLSENNFLQLWIVFEKNNIAYFKDEFLSEDSSSQEIDNPLTKHFEAFLGFKGTWEEVALKTVELNNLAVFINTIPPIPDALRE